MPYQRILDELVQTVDGHAALLLDSEGEVAFQAGSRDERHRLIGAYQGIGLATARRTLSKHDGGPIRYMMCRYTEAIIILRPLKDGYFLMLSLPVGGRVAEGVHRSEHTQQTLNREL
jgi:predicted regulator of Ras-like GTPase activity (Roadblock/LC7/MglB family)